MPAPHPSELRRRAVDLARQPGASVARVAKDLGISESGLRRWMTEDDIDSGRKGGPVGQRMGGTGPARREKPVSADGD